MRHSSVVRLVLPVSLLLLATGCKAGSSSSKVNADGGTATSARTDENVPAKQSALTTDAASAPRVPEGGSDVTFVVVSDTHFGYGGMLEQNRQLVDELNAIEGKAYPTGVGGKVGKPRGLLITGDLTEWGKVDEWAPFVATYGRDGTDGPLRLPVFEVIGNHDKVHGPWVEEQVVRRHGGRFYSWDWDDLHLVALGEAPDDEGLAFLSKDLAKLAPTVPVVLYFHLALEGPWSTGNWFADGNFKKRLLATLADHDILAIFHGHHHATDHYVWHGIDVFKPGAVKNDAHTFAVAHLTDERFTVDSFDWSTHRWGELFAKERKPQRR